MATPKAARPRPKITGPDIEEEEDEVFLLVLMEPGLTAKLVSASFNCF